MVDFSSTPLQHVCRCGHNMQDAGPTGAPQQARRTAGNAGSATLSADVGSYAQIRLRPGTE